MLGSSERQGVAQKITLTYWTLCPGLAQVLTRAGKPTQISRNSSTLSWAISLYWVAHLTHPKLFEIPTTGLNNLSSTSNEVMSISFKWVQIPVKQEKALPSQFCPSIEGEALSKGARALHRTHVCELSPWLRDLLFGWCGLASPWKMGLLLQWGNCPWLGGKVKGWESPFGAPHTRNSCRENDPNFARSLWGMREEFNFQTF